MSKWLSLAEACTYSRLSPATLLRAVKRGALRGYRVPKLWRFTVADLDAFLTGGPHA